MRLRSALAVGLAAAATAVSVTMPAQAHVAAPTSTAGTSTTQSTATADGSTTAASTSSTSRGPVFGAQFHGMWASYSDRKRNHVLSTLAANGVRSVRIDVGWTMLQPKGPHSYDSWGVGMVDHVLRMANRHGLRPVVTLWLTPAWANGGAGERTLPDHPRAYARVARWAAHRWAGKVAAWEVWNEPNDGAFMTGARPAAYAHLLAAAYPAFHAGDPHAKVVFGGPSYVDVDWVRAVLHAGAAHSFDVMGVHPYMGVSDAPPTTPDDGTEWTMRHISALHRLLGNVGRPHVHIWFTEFGWSDRRTAASAPNWARGVTAKQQARYLVETVRMVRSNYPYVTRLYWYDDLRDIESGFNGGYGLIHADGTPTAALKAVRTA